MPARRTGETGPDFAIDAAGSAAAPHVPRDKDGGPAPLDELAEAARDCTACELHEHATQTVFGEGRTGAAVMLVGEQPGDREDLAGHPFVGPAGQLLDRALAEAWIVRDEVYVTNAVKHFYFTERGKRRVHAKPKARHLRACRAWLIAEILAVRPRIVVCLGASAAQSLLGASFRLTRDRGAARPLIGDVAVIATFHPSALLRATDEGSRRERMEGLVADLREAARLAGRVRRG